MNRLKPVYFEKVREEARDIWITLEKKERIAGPWRQLFRQVQSPQHVISELLQNADDARATWASIEIVNNTFCFCHNGEDFNQSTFESICNFGISNKRSLHTIGFRGVGFKSTFSIGPRVEIFTPTIAVAFEKIRFTEPIWINNYPDIDYTKIQIDIDNDDIEKRLLNYVDDWKENPIPLLFFNNINNIEFQNESISKEVEGKGAYLNSEVVNLSSNNLESKIRLIHIKSDYKKFPTEAVEEIRNERNDEEYKNIKCQVEIVMGINDRQRFFVVLPTQVYPDIPFSCNAPFIQDPDRKRIKDPINSPTNQWLISRIGKLAAESIYNLVNYKSKSLSERSKAYELLPEIHERGNDLDDEITKIIIDEINYCLSDGPILIAQDREVVKKNECLGIPPEIINIWDDTQIIEIFGVEEEHVVAQDVKNKYREILQSWEWFTPIESDYILDRLDRKPYPPRPNNAKLFKLWEYVENNSNSYRNIDNLAIVPVTNQKHLNPRKSLIVMRDFGGKLSKKDKDFISKQVNTIDLAWIKLLKKLNEYDNEDNLEGRQIATLRIFDKLEINSEASNKKIIKHCTDNILQNQELGENGIRLAHIAARLDVEIPDSFCYKCRDGEWRQSKEGLYSSFIGEHKDFIPVDLFSRLCIHEDYQERLISEQREGWLNWEGSKKSKLHKFPLPKLDEKGYVDKDELEDVCKKRVGKIPDKYPLKKGYFWLKDYDFRDTLWEYWESKASKDHLFWSKLLRVIINEVGINEELLHIEVRQRGTKYKRKVDTDNVPTTWVYKIRKKRCVLDSNSNPSVPVALYRRSYETSPLKRFEKFVHEDIDKPKNYAILDALGVMSTSEDYGKLIKCLRSAAAESEIKNTKEILNIYDAIDSMLKRLSEDKIKDVKEKFNNERLILSNNSSWHSSNNIYIDNKRDYPGFNTIHEEISCYDIWKEIGVKQRPDLDDMRDWINNKSQGDQLSADDKKIMKQVLENEGHLFWKKYGFWLTIGGILIDTKKIKYFLFVTDIGKSLAQWVKNITADLSMLDKERFEKEKFDGIQPLDIVISWKVKEASKENIKIKPLEWIECLGQNLISINQPKKSIESQSGKENNKKHQYLARSLMRTKVIKVNSLKIKPYINNQAAGHAINKPAYWNKKILYVKDIDGNLHKVITEAISCEFNNKKIIDAIKACFERERNWVDEYCESEFEINESVREKLRDGESDSKVDTQLTDDKEQGPKLVKEEIQKSAETKKTHRKRKEISRIYIQPERKRAKKPNGIRRKATSHHESIPFGKSDQEVEKKAMGAVIEEEIKLGYKPKDVSKKYSWDIESLDPKTNQIRFIEVKGRSSGKTIIVTRNEVLAGLEKADKYFVVVVEVDQYSDNKHDCVVHYFHQPFHCELDEATTHVIYDWTRFK